MIAYAMITTSIALLCYNAGRYYGWKDCHETLVPMWRKLAVDQREIISEMCGAMRHDHE